MAIVRRDRHIHLQTAHTSYIIYLLDDKYVLHLYWGARLGDEADLSYLATSKGVSRASFTPNMPDRGTTFGGTTFADQTFEFSSIGNGDYRVPTYLAQYADGSTVSEFAIEDVRIEKGKPGLEGLPATYVEDESEAETLAIDLKDAQTGMVVTLSYSVYEDYDAITRNIRYHNGGEDEVTLLAAESATVDLPGLDYDILHLTGAWYRERYTETVPVRHGRASFGSNRGMSSHAENPFIALMERPADETHGNIYGFSLVYSGNYDLTVEGNMAGLTRVTAGINPENFVYPLPAGESFQAPECVLIHSDEGLGTMSRRYHRLYRERLARGTWGDRERPIVLNTWEGSYFDFDEARILETAEAAADLGVELLVMDDGWFGKRNLDDSSLGDWYVNKEKLPHGLDGLCEAVKERGLKMGIWVEPEMVSPDSDLYRTHPDWCLHAEGRRRTESRQQLILDYSRADVREYIIDAMTKVFGAADFTYVKWDCNRNIIETQNPAQSHRYMLGVYEVMETLVTRFPNILFESCSGGGGRFDPGMLYYMPQAWTSDNTTPDKRLHIQEGTSTVYPTTMMAAHVGQHIMQGLTKKQLDFSAHVAMAANFGYEMDATKMDDEIRERARHWIETYKSLRPTVQFGEMYRLERSEDGPFLSWQFVSEDGRDVVLFAYQLERQLNGEQRRVRLQGLDPDAIYTCDDGSFRGDTLMQAGIRIPLQGDREAASLFRWTRNDG